MSYFFSDQWRKHDKLILLGIISICIIIISFSTGYPYDEASFLTQYYYFYIFGKNIFYFWPFGIYYYIMMVAGYLFNIPFALFGMENVMVQEFSIKLPFLVSMGLTAIGIYFIQIKEGLRHRLASSIAFIFLLTPIVLYDAAFHGNGLIIALFFEIFSIVFLYKSKYFMSSVFLGMAAATYIYPVFLIIPVLYFVYRKTSKRISLTYLAIFLLIILFGQGLPIFVYHIYGISLSEGSILGGIAVVTPSGVTGLGANGAWGPYLMIWEINGYVIPLLAGLIIFISAMVIAGIGFIFLSKKPTLLDLIKIYFIESIIFVLFVPHSDPQYLVAIAPFSILLFSIRKDYHHLSFLTLLTFFDIGAFITSSTAVMFGFFYDLNPAINAYFLKSPIFIYYTLESLYFIALFIYLVYFLYKEHPAATSKSENTKTSASEMPLNGKVIKMTSYLVIFTLITLVLVAPGIHNPPSTIPSVGSLMQETYSASISKNSSNQQYGIDMGALWSSLDNYAKIDGTYMLQIPSGPPKTTDIGDFDQTSLIGAQPNATYSENFYFPFNSTFHGFFVIFGSNITPFVYLQGSNSNQYLNLTNFTYKVQTVDGTYNFFEIIDSETVSSGYYNLIIKVPQNNADLSVSYIGKSGAYFRTYISNVNVHVNTSSIPVLSVNSSVIPNVTLSLYLSLSSTISVLFNNIMLGNYSTEFQTSIGIPGNEVASHNTVQIYGYYNGTDPITLKYNPPLAFSAVVFEENLANFIIGTAFLVISSVFLWYLVVFVRRNV